MKLYNMAQLPGNNNNVTEENVARMIDLNTEHDTLILLKKRLDEEWLGDSPSLHNVVHLIHKILRYMVKHPVKNPELQEYYDNMEKYVKTIRSQISRTKGVSSDEKKPNE